LGVLTYEFLVGSPPFEAKGHSYTYKRISKVDLRFPTYLSKEAKDFISKLLVKRSSERMALQKAMSHPFIAKNLSTNNVPTQIVAAPPRSLQAPQVNQTKVVVK